MESILMSCEKISIKVVEKLIIQNISLAVNKNQIVGLLGPNGAGKTTTFYMMTGLIKPFEGQKNKRTLTVKYRLYYSPLKIWENIPKIFIEEVKFIDQISGKFIILDDLKKNKAKHLLKDILLKKEKLELIIRKEFENPIKKYFIKSE
jgi:ABC-type multidrug transport system ATPase subunit